MQILFAGMKRREPYLPGVEDHDDYKFWLYNEVRGDDPNPNPNPNPNFSPNAKPPTPHQTIRTTGVLTWAAGPSCSPILVWLVPWWRTRSYRSRWRFHPCLSAPCPLVAFSPLRPARRRCRRLRQTDSGRPRAPRNSRRRCVGERYPSIPSPLTTLHNPRLGIINKFTQRLRLKKRAYPTPRPSSSSPLISAHSSTPAPTDAQLSACGGPHPNLSPR